MRLIVSNELGTKILLRFCQYKEKNLAAVAAFHKIASGDFIFV